MGGKDVSEAVVEVAWAALTTQHETKLKELLAAKVLENENLRKSVEVYKKVIEDLELSDGVPTVSASNNGALASTAGGCHEPGTPDMYDQLRHKLSSSEFLQQLGSNEGAKPLADPSVLRVGDHEGGAWLLVWDDNVLPKEERDGLGTNEGYVVITQQDIVDGVACFVARSISSLPQSKTMNPDELQQVHFWGQLLFRRFQSSRRQENCGTCGIARICCMLQRRGGPQP